MNPRTFIPGLFRAAALAAFVASLPAASVAFAQGTLTGTVINQATGATLEGARVVLKERNAEAMTDSLGIYRFEGVPAGRVTVAVSYTGLSAADATAEIPATGTARKDFGLTSDIYRLDKFVVASEREGNAKAVTLQRLSEGVRSIVSADAFGGLAGNPADLAMRLPGVEGESVGGDMRYLRIRGLHQNLSTITQDGNRLADGASAGATREFQFQTVGSDSIERIEVTKSPTPDMDGDSIGGAVNLVSKSAFDSSPERRIRGSVGAIWRPTDPRDIARPNASLSYSEVFFGRLGVNLNLAYRPHGSIIDMSTQAFQQLPVGVAGPAYQYSHSIQDFRNIRTRSGAGLRLDFKLNDRVRFFANAQLNKHTEHTANSTVTWQTNQAIATTDPVTGALTGTNGITPGFTDAETRVRPVAASTVTLSSLAAYKLGDTLTLNAGGVHRHPGLLIDYDLYSSKSKAYYPGNNTFNFIAPGVGFVIRRDDKLFPSVLPNGGPDWTQLASYTQNSYTSARMVGWDNYLGASLNVKKAFTSPVPTYFKTGLRFREQTRYLDNTPYNTRYVGPDGVMGVNPATGRNDDNLAQFGLASRPFPDTELGRYADVPFPGFQANGRTHSLDPFIAANPTHWVRSLATDLQAAYTNNQQFKETITAAYFMGHMQLGRLGVLGGLRVEDTETDGVGALQVITPEERARRAAFIGTLTDAEIERRAKEEFGRRQRRTGDYRTLFPGVHFKYQFTPNLLARASYAENIGRPNVGQLIPRTSVNYDNQTLSTSNPSLEPQRARNFDLSAEMYFEPAGMFSVGVFQKEIRKFIYTAGGTTVPTGADNGYGGDYAGFAVTTQFNGGYAKVKGLEIGYSQQFTFLPAPWNGLGAYANATRMQAEGNYGAGNAIALAPNPRIAGFNPFVANVGISYIKGKLNLRASYNYRDRYLTTFNANESRAVYFAARPTVDVKTLYNVSRRLSVYLDVVNILTQPDRETQWGFGRANTTHYMVPQFFFGANFRN
ncbi:MAG: TonB-dependent receptor [Opitutaceae bacterium]|nr:TonB-dependent receptor [Opitutaceae bacterium]